MGYSVWPKALIDHATRLCINVHSCVNAAAQWAGIAALKGPRAEIDKILAANADKVAEYKSGKQQLFGFFVGQTMKAMQGKANPQVVNERLRAKLD